MLTTTKAEGFRFLTKMILYVKALNLAPTEKLMKQWKFGLI